MKTRITLSAVLSVLSVVAVAGSAIADQPRAKGTISPVTPEIVVVDVKPAPYNPDYNHSGTLDTQDIFDYLTGWFANKADCDVDGNGYLDGMDILNYINAWFQGPVSSGK